MTPEKRERALCLLQELQALIEEDGQEIPCTALAATTERRFARLTSSDIEPDNPYLQACETWRDRS